MTPPALSIIYQDKHHVLNCIGVMHRFDLDIDEQRLTASLLSLWKWEQNVELNSKGWWTLSSGAQWCALCSLYEKTDCVNCPGMLGKCTIDVLGERSAPCCLGAYMHTLGTGNSSHIVKALQKAVKYSEGSIKDHEQWQRKLAQFVKEAG